MCGSTNVNVIPLSAKVSIDYLIDYRWQSSYSLSKQTNFEITNTGTVIITELWYTINKHIYLMHVNCLLDHDNN